MPFMEATGATKRRRLWLRVLAACGLWLLVLAAHAAMAMHGLPLMRHFGVSELPAAPFYSDIAVDAQGEIALPFNTSGMYRGWVDADGDIIVATHQDLYQGGRA